MPSHSATKPEGRSLRTTPTRHRSHEQSAVACCFEAICRTRRTGCCQSLGRSIALAGEARTTPSMPYRPGQLRSFARLAAGQDRACEGDVLRRGCPPSPGGFRPPGYGGWPYGPRGGGLRGRCVFCGGLCLRVFGVPCMTGCADMEVATMGRRRERQPVP